MISKFVIKTPEKVEKNSPKTPPKKIPTSPKKKTVLEKQKESQNELYGEYLGPSREERGIIVSKLAKMFRAACNGKNYYKKFFPELKDTGDFTAAFMTELFKLK